MRRRFLVIVNPGAGVGRSSFVARVTDALAQRGASVTCIHPRDIEAAIADIQQLLGGQKNDLSAIALDMSDVPDFEQRVYALTRSIAPGDTLTYGDIATRLGDLALSRAVGQALGRNPFPIIVPCHRVLAAGGKSGGFSAPGGVETKRRMLEIEGARDLHPTLPWDPR